MKKLGILLAAIAITSLALAACGGDDDNEQGAETQRAPETQPRTETAPPPAAGALSRSDVEACLKKAGLELATGETPVINSVKAIGVFPGEGNLSPGEVGAGVFVYDSVADARSAADSVKGAAFDEVTQEGNVLVVYTPAPSPDDQAAIERCISG